MPRIEIKDVVRGVVEQVMKAANEGKGEVAKVDFDLALREDDKGLTVGLDANPGPVQSRIRFTYDLKGATEWGVL